MILKVKKGRTAPAFNLPDQEVKKPRLSHETLRKIHLVTWIVIAAFLVAFFVAVLL